MQVNPSEERQVLLRRAEGARTLIRAGDLDPLLALSWVIEPPEWLEGVPPPNRARMNPAEIQRARELEGRGLSHREIGVALGRSHAAVGARLRQSARDARTPL